MNQEQVRVYFLWKVAFKFVTENHMLVITENRSLEFILGTNEEKCKI